MVGRGKTVGQVGVGSREFAVLYGGPVGLQFDAVDGLGLCGNAQGKSSKKEGTIHRVNKITKVKMQIGVQRLHKSQLRVASCLLIVPTPPVAVVEVHAHFESESGDFGRTLVGEYSV